MRFSYDKKADALYIRFNENRYAESDEVSAGVVLDYDRGKRIIGIEILNVAKRFPREFQADLKHDRLPVTFDFSKSVPAAR